VTLRVELDRLPPDVVAALERGEIVEFETAGEVVATAKGAHPQVDWQEFFEARKQAPALDHEDFLRELERVREELNSPFEPAWQS
jgi:hypothetical protein